MEQVKLVKKNINLMNEFNKLLKDEEFKDYIDKLKIPYEELAKYTSILETCKEEYYNCKNCKSIFECKNKIEGHLYLPVNNNGIRFCYKACKYKKNIDKKTKYLDNIYTFNIPSAIKEANVKDIYMTDKNRHDVIKYLNKFMEDYLSNKNPKGLYLYGNFGCGKTYLISAIFNELAKQNIDSAIVFWPEYLRMLKTLFNDNNEFKTNYNRVKNTKLLLIDDLGAENNTTWSRDEILCPILQYRMENNLPTFITSNLDLDNLEKHLSFNGTESIKAKRIIERINQLTIYKEMISKNLR